MKISELMEFYREPWDKESKDQEMVVNLKVLPLKFPLATHIVLAELNKAERLMQKEREQGRITVSDLGNTAMILAYGVKAVDAEQQAKKIRQRLNLVDLDLDFLGEGI